MSEERIIVTALGRNKVGIVAGISTVLAEHNASIIELTSANNHPICQRSNYSIVIQGHQKNHYPNILMIRLTDLMLGYMQKWDEMNPARVVLEKNLKDVMGQSYSKKI